MPTTKNHAKKYPKKATSPLPPATDTQQLHQANPTRTTDESSTDSDPEHSNVGQALTRNHSHARGFATAFQAQCYPHWIVIGILVLLSAIGCQRWNVISGLLREMQDVSFEIIRQRSSLEGWLGKDAIDRRSNMSLEEFRRVYDGKRPVLITDVLQDWGAMQWDADFFLSQYGKRRVVMKAVQGTLEQAEGFALPLEKFIAHVQDSSPQHWTYVEDELFISHTENLKKDIGSCPYVEEDFFKLFPVEIRPWDAMLLWGTRYSRSSLHIDPYNWTGTNAVIKGRKQWKLYPPGQDELLYVLPHRMSGFPLKSYKYNSPVDAFAPDLDRYPDFANAKAIEFTQYPRELLIIPTGWFHQAYNAEETLAISGQVMNTANYRMVLEEIFKAGSVDVELLPSNFDDLPPIEQVRRVIQAIPESILKEGQEITELALSQVKSQPHQHT